MDTEQLTEAMQHLDPITKGLRETIIRNTNLSAYGLEQLADACNAVDAIHKSLEDEYAEMRTFVESLDDAAKKHEDVDLWGTRYIAGPVEGAMTATDELHRLLDELRKLACDINEKEIRSHSVITLNQGRYNRQFRLDMNHDWLNAWHAELERILQAIAATLGTGTLTAEQVSNATYAHSIHADCADADWQAIADELNATLGTKTCRLVETEHEREIFDGGYYSYWSYDCDECGHENTEYGRFCAGCGAKVVSE